MHQYATGAHGDSSFLLCAYALRHEFPSAEGGFNQDVPGCCFLFHHIQEQVYTSAGDFLNRLFNRRQPRECEAADIHPVESYDADILRYRHPEILQGPDGADRDGVAHGKEGCRIWTLCEECAGDVIACFKRKAGFTVQAPVVGEAAVGKSVAETLETHGQ